jgi:hypothetical protein
MLKILFYTSEEKKYIAVLLEKKKPHTLSQTGDCPLPRQLVGVS